MSQLLSNRVMTVKPSATFAISAKAKALRAEGVDVINLSVGEPDFPTPSHICAAAIAAINEGHTKYPQIDGLPSLKEAIIHKLNTENNLSYAPNEIIVSTGAKQSLYNACQALINQGDEAIIPAPYWVSYPDMVNLAEGAPIIIQTTAQASFKITPAQLEEAITDKSRVLFLNSPSNPSGMCYSANELAALGAVIEKHPNLIVLSDDIYEHIRWDQSTPYVNIANAYPAIKDQVVVVNGASKAYAMTGWRIGFTATTAALTSGMKKVQSHSTSGASTISQYAAIAAFSGDQTDIATMRTAYKRRHDLVLEGLNNLPGVSCIATDGSFYLFPDVSEVIKKKGLTDDAALCDALIEKAHIACVPGSAFGAPGNIRFSTATSDELLSRAITRFNEFIIS